MTLWELLQSGGIIVLALAAASMISWFIVIERWLVMRRWLPQNRSFLDRLTALWIQKDRAGIHALLDGSACDLSDLARDLIDRMANDAKTQTTTKKIWERGRLQIGRRLKARIWLLGTIASLSPFLGLFGTVVGIIESFQSLSQNGAGGFAVVAAGISHALVATAVGILVALTALLFFNMLNVKLNHLTQDVRHLSEDLRDLLEGTPWASP